MVFFVVTSYEPTGCTMHLQYCTSSPPFKWIWEDKSIVETEAEGAALAKGNV